MFPPASIPVGAEGAVHTARGPDAKGWDSVVPVAFVVHFSQRAGASTGSILPF